MARIQMPDFGNAVARPGPAVQADPDAFGAAGGRALQQAGNMGMQIADRAINQQEQERKQSQAQERPGRSQSLGLSARPA